MRPNYAQDPPPTAIVVGGGTYPIDADFITWISVTKLMREFIPDAETPEHIQHNAEIMTELQTAVFGGVLVDETPADILRAISEFLKGYPNAPTRGSADVSAPLYSLEYDLNYIILAIRNQSGIDLSYRRKEPFHWWEFQLEFSSLCGEHYILRLMDTRGYTGKDPDALREKARCALPRELTAAEQIALDEINDEFYGA